MDLAELLAFEAGAQTELDADEMALEFRRDIFRARAALAELPAGVTGLGEAPAGSSEQRDKLIKEVATLARKYLERYRAATEIVTTRIAAGGQAVDTGHYLEFRQRLADFGEQAAVLARRGGRDRYVVAHAGPDASGVVAKVSAPFAASQFNVEAATMAVIGNLVTTAMVVSFPRNPDLLSMRTAADREQVTDLAARMEGELRPELGGSSGGMLKVLPRPQIPEILWPRPGSSVWHLRAATLDPAAVSMVTRAIADRQLPLLTFSTWTEAKAHKVDLTLAVPPQASGDGGETGEIIFDLQHALEERLGYGSVVIAPADRPTRGAPDPSMRVPERAQMITVIGEARPGFVDTVISRILTFPLLPFQVVGANMAILEVFSVVTVVVASSGSEVASPSWHQLAGHLKEGLDQRDEVLEPCSIESSVKAPSRHRPTHELTVEAAEQPGVLAKVSKQLGESEPPVNIVWLSSYVLEPRVGEDRLRCWMQIQVDLSDRDDRSISSLQQELGWLAAQNRWDCLVLRSIGS